MMRASYAQTRRRGKPRGTKSRSEAPEGYNSAAMSAYFDHNATTPLDPRVRDAMLPWLSSAHGNPSSAHAYGRAARAAVEAARAEVAALLGAEPEDVVFTSSGSEANNAVIAAAAAACGFRGHLVTSTLEHPSVRAAAACAAAGGMDVTELQPAASGLIEPDAVAAALRPDSRLVCTMAANNELGTIQPVAEIAAVCAARGVPVLADAVQAVGKIAVDAPLLGASYVVLGGHKFHGPYGAAALWLRRGAGFVPLLVGAPQEGGRRASTENVPAIVGLGEAARLAACELAARYDFLRRLRDRFEAGLARIAGTSVHCADTPRLPHTSHVAFAGHVGYDLMMALDARGMAVSIGAACHSGKPQPSAALLAMGFPADEALASLRVSFGMTNTEDEVHALLGALAEIVGAGRDRRASRSTPG